MRLMLGAAVLLGLATEAMAQENGAQPTTTPPAVASPAPGASGSSAPAPATEAAADVDKLADCLVQHSAQPESDAMKRVMVAALSDDTPGLKSALSEFSGLLLKLSMSSCGVGLSQLQDPAYAATFQQASSKYGAVLGAKLMQDAFAKLN